MISIVLIGTGNVAQHLFDIFQKHKELKVVQVLGRNQENLTYFEKALKTGSDFRNIEPADIYIIAVSDDAISSVSEQITNKNSIVVHTSGSVPLENLSKHKHRGVFYPLQTFSKDQNVYFKTVPMCLEAEHQEDLDTLKRLAGIISDKVYEISSNQRKKLHLAAVFVNNFTNHLYHIGNTICKENNIPFEILKPLIRETANKIENLSPFAAQTGPAKRDDNGTIKQHLKELKNEDYKEIYKTLSKSIKEEYKHRGFEKKA